MRVALKVYSETTSNLHTFWIKVQMEYPEIAKKSNEKPASVFNILSLGSGIFCSDSDQNEMTE